MYCALMRPFRRRVAIARDRMNLYYRRGCLVSVWADANLLVTRHLLGLLPLQRGKALESRTGGSVHCPEKRRKALWH